MKTVIPAADLAYVNLRTVVKTPEGAGVLRWFEHFSKYTVLELETPAGIAEVDLMHDDRVEIIDVA